MTPTDFAKAVLLARNTLPHGQRPTDTHVRIAWILARWQNPCPSHAKLARAARCHRNTVRNALERFRALGLLTWQHQTDRLRGGWGGRIANRYSFPSNALPLPRPVARKKGKTIFSCPTKFVQPATADEVRAAQQALAVRRAAFAAAQLAACRA